MTRFPPLETWLLSSLWLLGALHVLSNVFYATGDGLSEADGGIPWSHTLNGTFSSVPSAEMNASPQLNHSTSTPLSNTTAADSKYLTKLDVALTYSCLFAGWLLGSSGWSLLADRYGRRPMALLSLLSLVLADTLLMASSTFLFYLIGRAFLGSAVGGIGVIAYVWGMEFLTPEEQQVWGALFQLSWSVGGMLLPLLVKGLPHWRTYIAYLLALTMLIVVILVLAVKESPRWLRRRETADQDVVRGRSDGVEEEELITKQLAERRRRTTTRSPSRKKQRRFGTTLFEGKGNSTGSHFGGGGGGEEDEVEIIQFRSRSSSRHRSRSSQRSLSSDSSQASSSSSASSSPSLLPAPLISSASPVVAPAATSLLGHSYYRHVTGCLAVVWWANAFIFYGLNLNAQSLMPGNLYQSVLYLNLLAVPAQVLSMPFALRFTAKRCLLYALPVLSLLFGLLAIPVGDKVPPVVRLVGTLVGQGLSTFAFTLCYTVSASTYPTRIRGQGVGVGVMMGRIGAMLGPLLSTLHSVSGMYALLAGVSGLAAVAMFYLPKKGARS